MHWQCGCLIKSFYLKPLLSTGNEGYGLRTTVRRSCGALLRIDDHINTETKFELDSLNVSVAAGILLHSIVNNRDRNIQSDLSRQQESLINND